MAENEPTMSSLPLLWARSQQAIAAGKCRRDARGPASSKCRCNPCSESSARWPGMRRRDRTAIRADDGGEAWPGNFVEDRESDLYIVLLVAAQRTANGVEEKTLGLINGVGREILN